MLCLQGSCQSVNSPRCRAGGGIKGIKAQLKHRRASGKAERYRSCRAATVMNEPGVAMDIECWCSDKSGDLKESRTATDRILRSALRLGTVAHSATGEDSGRRGAQINRMDAIRWYCLEIAGYRWKGGSIATGENSGNRTCQAKGPFSPKVNGRIQSLEVRRNSGHYCTTI